MPTGGIAELDATPTADEEPRHRPGVVRRPVRPSRPQSGRRATPTPPITLQVEGLTARAPGTPVGGPLVLDDVRFTVRRGWLVGVLGPTGVGKTSLLAALTGRLNVAAGSVRVVGRAAHVPQDDVLHGRLGLRRTLHHAATLRLPRGVLGADRRERIDGVLADLGLAGKAASAIDTLSGGERKRANVAVELVGRPDVVLLDEPTSGLDPGHEQSVLAALRQVADGGRTVLAVTHGLAALPVCDRVLVLGRGGRVAFFGPPAAAKAFFGSLDAATLFRDLDSIDGAARWADRFRAHPAHEQLVAGGDVVVAAGSSCSGSSATDGPRCRTQLATLVHRSIELLASDRRRLALLAVQGPILGLLLWSVLRPHGFRLDPMLPAGLQLGTVAMFLAVSATWLGAATAVREIVDELPIVRRERGAGLSLGAYVASKALVLGGIAAVSAAALGAVAILRQDPPAVGAVLPSGALEVVLTCSLVAVAAVAVGLCTSAFVTTSEKALTALPLVLVAQLVLAGPWASGSSTPGLGVLRSLVVARWGAAAVEATGRGSAGDWWSAVVALAALTVVALVGTLLLVRRRAGVPRVRVVAGGGGAGGSGRAEAGSVRWAVPTVIALVAVGGFVLLGGGDDLPPAGPPSDLVAADTMPDNGLADVVPSSTTAPTVPVTVVQPVAPVVEEALEVQPVAPPTTAVPTPPTTEPAAAEEPSPPTTSPSPSPPPSTESPAPTTTPPPSTTATTAPPAAPPTTILPTGGGRTVTASNSSPWDVVLFWWDVAQAFR